MLKAVACHHHLMGQDALVKIVGPSVVSSSRSHERVLESARPSVVDEDNNTR